MIKRARGLAQDRYVVLDPRDPETREKRFEGKLPDVFLELLDSHGETLDLLVKLITTPRALKASLKRTLLLWDVLCGEVDLDELLITKVLQECAPEAYDFIQSNVTRLRLWSYESSVHPEESRRRRDQLVTDWERKTDRVEWDVGAAWELVKVLFPEDDSRKSEEQAPQSVARSEVTDYWARIVASELQIGEISDQSVLQAVESRKDGKDTENKWKAPLSEVICSNKFVAAKVEQFSHLMTPQELASLASELFSRIRGGNVRRERDDSGRPKDIPGFIELWRSMLRRPMKEKEHLDWITRELRASIPVDLRLAVDLYYYHRFRTKSEADGKHFDPQVWAAFLASFRAVCLKSPASLNKVLDSSYPYTLYHIVHHFTSKEERGVSWKEEDSQWLGHALYMSAIRAKSTVLPHIAILIFCNHRQSTKMDEHGTRFEDRYTLDEEFARELFGSRLRRIMELLAEDSEFPNLDESERVRLESARNDARIWLKKGQPSAHKRPRKKRN